jgi:hypothetical protein
VSSRDRKGRRTAGPLLRTEAPAEATAYATKDELEAFIVGGISSVNAFLSDEEIATILVDASRDLDRYFGPSLSTEANGLRLGDLATNPKELDAGQLTALRRAACAQAAYRIRMGPEFFEQDQYEEASGPDFATTGKLGRIGPRAREELRWSGLMQAVGGKLVT